MLGRWAQSRTNTSVWHLWKIPKMVSAALSPVTSFLFKQRHKFCVEAASRVLCSQSVLCSHGITSSVFPKCRRFFVQTASQLLCLTNYVSPFCCEHSVWNTVVLG